MADLRAKLETNAKHFSSECRICGGMGFRFDPLYSKQRGDFVLCQCLKSKARSEGPPYMYFDEATNTMVACPTQDAQHAIERIHYFNRESDIPGRYEAKYIENFQVPEITADITQDEMSLIEALSHAVQVIVDFEKGESRGLYLYGPTGCGKTLLTCIILNEIVRLYQRPVRYAKIGRDVIGKLKASFNPNSEFYGEGRSIEQELAKVDVLAIDDFGAQQETDWVHSVLYDLIDARYENDLLTIVTSNVPLSSIREVAGGRVFSRLSEMCIECHMKAPDYRLKRAAN